MDKKQSYEDYLEVVLLLEEMQGEGTVRMCDVANFMNFTRPSVSIAMKKMEADKIIILNKVSKDSFINLTPKGKKIAQTILHRHRVLTNFFIALGVDNKIAEDDACKVEHCISEETFAAFEKFLKDNIK